ncbi:MAG: permease [Candidatus Methylomirabilales bacterium]
MALFWQQAWFFTIELFKFMTLFYTVWVPGFLVAALLTLRYRRSTWDRLLESPSTAGPSIWRAMKAGIVGSADREISRQAAWELLKRGRSPATAFAYLIASRNMTIHFWAIFALSLGAEFATGQVLGALVMIGVVALGLNWLRPPVLATPAMGKAESNTFVLDLASFPCWRALLLSLEGWWAMLKFIGHEVRRFTPTLVVGIILGGLIFAAGLESWWIIFADIMGRKTPASDLLNALASPAFSAIMFLSPVGNLPVIHALFKTDGLAYPGIISFCLASAIHPRDVRIYFRTFGGKQGLILVGLLYAAAILGGLGSTWIYALFGFRPDLPPLKLISKILPALGF